MAFIKIYVRFFLLVCTGFLAQHANAQFVVTLQGEVRNDFGPLENAHIKNIYTGEHIVSDSEGLFFNQVRSGDVLHFSHVAYQDKRIIISDTDMERGFKTIVLHLKTNELSEVEIVTHTKITPESVGIVSTTQRIPTANERRLHTAGDFKPIHLLGLLVGNLQIDPILNAINGRTKRLKKYIALDKKIAVNETLVYTFQNYIMETLDLSEEEAIQFFDYLVDDENVEELLAQATVAQLEIYLIDTQLTFRKVLEQEQKAKQ